MCFMFRTSGSSSGGVTFDRAGCEENNDDDDEEDDDDDDDVSDDVTSGMESLGVTAEYVQHFSYEILF